MASFFLCINNFIHVNPTHGAFLICKLYKESNFINLNIQNNNGDAENNDNISKNLITHNIKLKDFYFNFTKIILIDNFPDFNKFSNELDLNDKTIFISVPLPQLDEYYECKIKISTLNLWLYLPKHFYKRFYHYFSYYIINDEFNYSNLVNLCILVKNGGDTFKQVLEENLPYFDKWTILDTGSTDSTVDIVNEVLVGKKKGTLHNEPFSNFRDSRNKLLELAGNSCCYTLMLDDTYIVKGNLIDFLTTTRGDQFSTSFSMYLNSSDSEYASNRLIKTNTDLKYIHKIHEVVTPVNNNNVMIPKETSYVLDIQSDFMQDRTNNRKYYDLQLLREELEEDPNNTRTHYYFATTYSCLKQYDLAFEWFMKRVNHNNDGFIPEKAESYFEAARLANFKLNKPWPEVQKLYEKASEVDPGRPDSLYFIGIHYYLENDFKTSHEYFQKAYKVGYPINSQFSLKPTLSFHFCPKFLCTTCWHNKDYKLGEEVSRFYLTNGRNDPNTDESYTQIVCWHKIYCKINSLPQKNYTPQTYKKPVLCFVADGGFKPWSGSTILNEGVGGSETYIIEMARYIQKSGNYDVAVFCNCPQDELFEDVRYSHLNNFPHFIMNNRIKHCIISRYTEYIPMTYNSHIENVYLVLHDITLPGTVIPRHSKLKNIMCLTEWHVSNFTQFFPTLADITTHLYYGVDTDKFLVTETTQKTPFKFIYSSYPNRGLLELLKMWPSIYEMEPRSTLHIYSDVNNKWSNDVEPKKMQEIKILLDNYKSNNENNLGIHYHSWVSKKELADSWKTAEYWLYPCTFQETFCLTALEAAISKTFVITNNLAALQNTVGDRGLIIHGDPQTQEWKDNALTEIKQIFKNNTFKNTKINENFEWASRLTWENRANTLMNNYLDNNIYVIPDSVLELVE